MIVCTLNLFIDIMEVDAAQYAEISMEMMQTGSYLQVYEQGYDYLDKPPLLFWLSSLSMTLFGINSFAYKFPSFLFAILAVYSTWRFALLWYDRKTAMLSALVLSTCQAMFLITNDVRTDTLLMGSAAFAFWRISAYLRHKTIKNLLLISLAVGTGMLAKGPVALVYVVLAFGFEFMAKKQWQNIFHTRWLIVAAGIALLLAPMCYGLYRQFDLHPDKIVYDLKGPSGLRFYFWTQSFGRITGENYWDNNAGYLYFFQSILWDFQPWILALIPAISIKIYRIATGRTLPEYITLGGFCLMFLALSLSSYKLPHYIFILFPAASVLTADFLLTAGQKLLRPISWLHLLTMAVLVILMIIGLQVFFPPENKLWAWSFTLLILSFFVSVIWLWVNQTTSNNRFILAAASTAVAFNLFMAVHFYPSLLRYQAPTQAGRYLLEHGISPDMVCKYEVRSTALDYCYGHVIPNLNPENILPMAGKGLWIYTDGLCRQDLLDKGLKPRREKIFNGYSVTLLSLPFLHPATRPAKLKKLYLLEI